MNAFLLFAIALIADSSCIAAEPHVKRQAEALASLPACTDFGCLCRLEKFTKASVTCVVGTCTSTEQIAGATFSQKACSAVGVTLHLPTPTGGPSDTPAPAAPAPPVPVDPKPVLPTTPCIYLGSAFNGSLANGTTFNVTFSHGTSSNATISNATISNATASNVTLRGSGKSNGTNAINSTTWNGIPVCPPLPVSTPPTPTNTTPTSPHSGDLIDNSYNAAVKAQSSASKRDLSVFVAVFLGCASTLLLL
ncbi:hypothetical protein CROQUDRAFT_111176 [Cronartium quercuum f. sp. fusiforme G11]|uniref:Extracellular membrane protein CFEM domain-containing protein n=1 Tax=Cronartium quercuum f. sp. fusiforme G11 TaxID=708437 RepID=A0A9P6N6X4_9BASI|nr:hypothetical protein CROQUDRAFT_111176 [Cronartium quercuum f. sp. fusiforme G11]